jgi:hypothetical protein
MFLEGERVEFTGGARGTITGLATVLNNECFYKVKLDDLPGQCVFSESHMAKQGVKRIPKKVP